MILFKMMHAFALGFGLILHSMNLVACEPVNTGLNAMISSELIRLDSLPDNNASAIIWEMHEGREVKIKIENSKIVQLHIDGKLVPSEAFHLYPDIVNKYEGTDDDSPFMAIDTETDIKTDTAFSWNHFRNFSLDSLFGQDPFSIQLDSREWNFEDLIKRFQEQLPELKSFDFEADSLFNPFSTEFLNGLFQQGNGSNGSVKIYRFDDNQWKSMDGLGPDSSMDGKNPDNNKRDFTEVLGDALIQDGFLIPGKENKVELSLKSMKINGEKQPSNIHQKYRQIFEEVTGTQMDKKSKIKFSVKSTSRYPARRL